MQKLASLFVGLIALINAGFPQANLPAVLGVNVENEDAVTQVKQFYEDRVRQSSMESSNSSAIEKEEANQRRQDAIDEFIQNQQEVRRRIQAQRVNFGKRLGDIKELQRRAILERVSNNLNTINQRWVEKWMIALDRMYAILIKIELRNNLLRDKGVDVSSSDEDIDEAKLALNKAREALNEQVQKVYQIDFDNEENLGEGVSESVAVLRSDLSGTKDLVKDAKESVVKALSQLKIEAESSED